MDLTRQTLEHVARLARVRLEGDEVERLRVDLERVLDLFETLPDAPDLPAQVAPGPTREDTAIEPTVAAADALLANVPRKSGRAIHVPGGWE